MAAATLTATLRSTCARCGRAAVAGARFCSACGTAIFSGRAIAPIDLAARRTVQLGSLTVTANIVVGAATFGVVAMVSGAPRYVAAALVLEALHLLVVGALAIVTLRAGATAIRHSRDGRTRLSPWTVVAVVVVSLVLVSLVVSFGLVAAMNAGIL